MPSLHCWEEVDPYDPYLLALADHVVIEQFSPLPEPFSNLGSHHRTAKLQKVNLQPQPLVEDSVSEPILICY